MELFMQHVIGILMVLEEQLLCTDNIIYVNSPGKLKNAEFEFQNMFVFHYSQ